MAKKKIETRVEEYPSPTDFPWDIHFNRVQGDQNVEVVVCGSRGGLKARFHVRLKDLQNAVSELDSTEVR